jgi:hypothetical protein
MKTSMYVTGLSDRTTHLVIFHLQNKKPGYKIDARRLVWSRTLFSINVDQYSCFSCGVIAARLFAS